MGDFPYLDWLTKKHFEKAKRNAEKADSWVDFLKAHGLANSCVVRCSTKERLQTVYDIETSWYNGNHPMSFDDHQKVTKQQQLMLSNYRKESRADFEHLSKREDLMSIASVCDEDKTEEALKYSADIFKLSEKCTGGLIDFAKDIIQSSVDSISQVLGDPPCSFVVVGLGSLARGVATPYSDLEYAFIVESYSEVEQKYFEMLAVDTYFRIGNLGETPLQSLNIDNMYLKCGRRECVLTETPIGFHIDGITEGSGNIPTGNGMGKYPLTFTVEQCLHCCSEEARKPPGKLVGDLSNLLATSVPIYTYGTGKTLYNNFIKKLSDTSAVLSLSTEVKKKQLATLSNDIKRYSFLPKIDPFSPVMNSAIQIKEDIFRYPTLLATDIGILLGLDTNAPWDTYKKLVQMEIISQNNCDYFIIALAISVYIRTTASLSLDFGSNVLSVHTSATEYNSSDRYHAPRSMFVTLGSLLEPIKSSISSELQSMLQQKSPEDLGTTDIIRSIFQNIQVSKDNYLLTAKVLHFVGDSHTALKTLIDNSSEEVVQDYCKFSNCVDKNCGPGASGFSKKEALILCFSILFSTAKYTSALNYSKVFATTGTDEWDKVQWRIVMARCMNHVAQYHEAIKVLDDVLVFVKQMCLPLNQQSDQTQKKHVEEEFFEYSSLEHCNILMEGYISKAETLCELHQPTEAQQSIYYALSLGTGLKNKCKLGKELMWSLEHQLTRLLELAGSLCQRLGDSSSLEYLVKALLRKQELYGKNTNHEEIGRSYNHFSQFRSYAPYIAKSIPIVPSVQSMLDASIEVTSSSADFSGYALNMLLVTHGAHINHPDIAACHGNIGKMLYHYGNYSLALLHHTQSIEMLKAVYGENANHPQVAESYNNIGEVHSKTGEDPKAIECFFTALSMFNAVFRGCNHPKTAITYSNIGTMHHSNGKWLEALECHSKALAMMKAVYGKDANHTDIALCHNNIGRFHEMTGDLSEALQCYTSALAIWKAVFGEHTDNSQIASSYNNIACIHGKKGEFGEADEYHSKALKMKKAVYGEQANHADIAESYNNIGGLHEMRGKLSEALESHNTALDMWKAVYGKNTNHPEIARCYNNIACIHDRRGETKKATEKATEMHFESLNMKKAIYYGAQADHPDIAVSYLNIATVRKNKGELEKALRYQLFALDIYKAVYGEHGKHPDIATVYNNIGAVYFDMKDYATALAHLTTALEIRKTVYKKATNHPLIAGTYSNLGYTYMNMSDFPKALECHNNSLHMNEAIYNTDHADIAQNYSDICEALRETGDYERSLRAGLKSIIMFKFVHGVHTDHLDIAMAHSSVAKVYSSMNKRTLSQKEQAKATHMMNALYGEDSD